MLTFLAGVVAGSCGSFVIGALCLAAAAEYRAASEARRRTAFDEQLVELMYRRRTGDIAYDGSAWSDGLVRSGTLKWT